MKPGDMIRVHIWKEPRTGILLNPPGGDGMWRVFWNSGRIERLSNTILGLPSTELMQSSPVRDRMVT
jgi:hypothetical protein